MSTLRHFPAVCFVFVVLAASALSGQAQSLPDLRIPNHFAAEWTTPLDGPKPAANPEGQFTCESKFGVQNPTDFSGKTFTGATWNFNLSSHLLPGKAHRSDSPLCTGDAFRTKGEKTEPLALAMASPPCPNAGELNLGSLCGAQSSLNVTLWGTDREPEDPIIEKQRRMEHFHWTPALLQSLEFLVFEHAFRAASDPYLRYLVMHKPFWSDWAASADHFDMSRWGDGDDFLVNYIGHPLQGSVTSNIFIQNDPRGRLAKFGRSRDYWESRMKGMLWAAVYSAYFEIGPILSEAAIGNEGGYTYIPNCGFYPTCPQKPGVKYKSPTNNTGWVDFVVTPTIGTGWTILEDFLEVQITDRVVAKYGPSAKTNILRGALSPSRTLSNMLAGRYPWYRFHDPDRDYADWGVNPRQPKQPWDLGNRWNLGMHYTNTVLRSDREGCNGCRENVSGYGVDFGYQLFPLLWFDSVFNVYPGSGSGPTDRGRVEEGLFGVKFGKAHQSWGLFAESRPGFIHYEKTLATEDAPEYSSVTRFAWSFGAVAEYYPAKSKRSTIRFDIGTTMVRYLTGRDDPRQPPVSVLSEKLIATQGSFHVASGYVFRF